MAVGRITGPLLKANLLRNGVDLAFETDLLYLDVNNGRVGIKTSLPDYDLDVNGTTRSTNLTATTQADLATFNVATDTISSSSSIINLRPAGANPVVYQGKIQTGDLQLSTNTIETTATDQDLDINTLGTGQVNVNANLNVNGDVHVTGNLQVDGDASGTITIGDADTDNVEFKADVNSNIIPDDNETWDLGSNPTSGGKRWKTVYTKDLIAQQITASNVLVDGIDLTQIQGNIYYVATTGSNSNAGEHEHDPVLTLKYALSLANAGDCIYIFPGVYQEIFPLTVPAGVSVKGAGLRSVKITPTVGTRFNDAFLLNGETTIEDLTIADFFSTSTAQITLSSVLNNPNAYSTSSSDQFGWSVAVSDNYAIVGAVSEDDAGGQSSGKAYIFNTTTGALVHTLNNPNAFGTSLGDQFALSVGISGNYAIVSATVEDDAGGTDSGKVYIYNVTTGALIRTLNNPNAYSTSGGDLFGRSIAVSGNYAIVGAVSEDDAGGSSSGKAYIFDLTHASTDSTTSVQVEFGAADNLDGTFTIDLASLGITDPGALIIINSVDIRGDLSSNAIEYIDLKLSTAAGYNRYISGFDDATYRNFAWLGGQPTSVGNVNIDYIIPPDINFSPTGMPNGYFWQVRLNITVTISALRHVLNNPNAYSTSGSDNFGLSVDISDNYAIVGAYLEDDAGGSGAGKAYVFNVASGALVQTLNNPNAFGTSVSDQFGLSVGISGNYAIVGAYPEDDAGGTSSGKAYIFNATTGALIHTLNNPNAYSTSASDQFGFSVDISGNYAIVSANVEDDAGGTSSGKVYIFSTISGQLLQTINNPNAYSTSAGDQFGHIVAISGNYAMVGAIGEDDAGGTDSGKAYIYNLTGTVENGYAFRFATGMTVTNRSPYIRNVTVITKGSTTSVTDPYGFDSGDAGKGALADGSVVNAASVEASMLFHSVTFITPNQEAITATNGVRIEWLNSFSYFADKGLYLTSGPLGFAGVGQTRLRIENRTGTWAVGNTVLYYNTDGTTLLASGTISSINGNYINLAGKCSGFETITDRVGKTVYAQGNAKLSTSIRKFGTASLALDGTGDYATVPSQPDFNFGTGDFTIECWIYRSISNVQHNILDFRTTNTQNAPVVYIQNTNQLTYYVNGSIRITGTTVSTGVWHHVALSRQGTSTKLFFNGAQVGSTWTDTTDYIQSPLTIGSRFDGISGNFNGYIDDVRVTKGLARYTSTFITPTAAFVGDTDTVLLLHFNGTNNSTTFIDDGVTLQDLRTNAGGTASLIQFADYSDFGAELRAIGSAAIYGNYGAYGEGEGVIAYLISQNFAYVGSGKVSTNDPNDRIAANEVTKLNLAKIYYTSVDNEGNFSIGDAFFVNQETGDVLFNGESLNITVPGGITFTNGVNSTTITPTDVTTGNIRISGNTIESITGDVNVTAASGSINLQNNTFITGNLDVTGDIILGGNIQVGDANTDTINFVGGISSNLVPSTTATYDLGTPSLRWDNVFLNRVEIDNLVIDNNTIETTTSNDNLILKANGTGVVSVPNNDVLIDQNLTVTTDLTVSTGTTYLKNTGITGTVTQTGDFNQTGDFTSSGTLQVTGNTELTGYLDLPNISINGNTISTKTAGSDLLLSANGTGDVLIENLSVDGSIISSTVADSSITLKPLGQGIVEIDSNQSLKLPVGGDSDRPLTPASGMIRYNSDLSRYEGYNNGYWLSMSGVADADGNTYITAELTPGANDNTLRFYADSSLMVTIDATKLYAERLQTSNLDIQDDTITPISPNSDLNLSSTGTGSVRLGNLSVKNNTITNIVSGAVTQFSQTGTGYIKIEGTNGLVFPSGSDSDRPAAPVLGMMRYNTQQQLVEVYNGSIWTGVAGSSGGVTFAEASAIAIEYVLVLG